MNKNNYKGPKVLNDFGMSPILIVVVVLLVLVFGGVGYGYYLYTTNPFLRVYDSLVKFSNVKEVKSAEVGFEVSGTFNPGKLMSESPSLQAESKEVLDSLNRDVTFKYLGSGKYNLENGSVLGSFTFNLQNLILPEPFKDSLNGDIFAADMYLKGINNKNGVFDVYAFKITKLPENISNPLTGEKINLDPLKNTWIDMSSMYKMSYMQSQNLKSDSKSVTPEIKPLNSIMTCEKKTLSFFQRISLARAGTKLFSKAENKGQVDYDGGKATSLRFEMDANKKSEMVEALDEMSKIVCVDSSNLENEKFVDTIIKGLSLSKISYDYLIDSKTGYPAKLSAEFTSDSYSAKLSYSMKNINNASFEEPKDLVPAEKFLKEKLTPILGEPSTSRNSQMNGLSPMGSMNPGMGSSNFCRLTSAQKSTMLSECNTAPATAGLKNRSGFCTCAISQVEFGPCGDKAALQQRITTYCSAY